MLEKMQIWAIFLSSKWVVKQQRQLTISTMHLAQELLTKVQYSSASGSFAKEMRGLKMNSPAAGPWKLMTNWEQSLKQILLQLHEKLLKNSTVTIIRSIGICSKLARWKCLISGCLISWLQIKKIIVLKCHLLLFYTTNHFLTGLWHGMKSGFYTTGDNQLSGSTEKQLPSTSQGQIVPKKVMVIVWWSAACLTHYSFLNQWNHSIWEVSSAHWWHAPKTAMPAANTGQQNGPNSPWKCQTAHLTTNASKVEQIGRWSFASSAIFTWPLVSWLPFLQASQQLFVGKILLQPAGGRKYWVRQILKHGFLHYRNKQTYFSLAKMDWL